MRLFAALIAVAASLPGVEIRKSAQAYPAFISIEGMDIGVEYMVTSFSAEGQTFTVDDHLLLEIGVYPRGETKVDMRRFNLRINGKQVSMAQIPGMVAASVKYSDWTQKPSVQASAGPIILGRPQATERFPGAPRTPQPRREPVENDTPRPEPVDLSELIKKWALPEGMINRPVAGYLYFPYDGKLKSIRTVELLIDETALKIR